VARPAPQTEAPATKDSSAHCYSSLKNLIGGESLLHQHLINQNGIATFEVFESADDNSSSAAIKEENQDWNLTVADVMIVGSSRASISTTAQLHRFGGAGRAAQGEHDGDEDGRAGSWSC
jgi:hypothetical protein